MDQLNFILYSEYELEGNKREIHGAMSIYRHDLLRTINNYAKSKGLSLVEVE